MLITIVEDNIALAEGIANALRDQGHGVDILNNGDGADAHLKSVTMDLVILDLGLPGMQGLEVLKRMRGRQDTTPVLILTAKKELRDRVEGLDAGADDYLGKPFAMEELEARVRALLRRGLGSTIVETMGLLAYDKSTRTVLINEVPIELPRRELVVFECLLKSKGRLVAKESLFNFVYGTGADIGESAIEVYISRLRKRLKASGLSIRTARGLGYRLEHTE
ncbi:MAG: response regulator transcription factor [Silicimonas sp.]|nr:response regulator transcription factor [Silicimonas sp.]NND18773.1 response regulator transcription factor [Silicimonas sp.]NND22393.1 response regulator transcription factor [Silicimonas sp.]NNL34200.1 response regulator transcription factor [Silicimonas sp.]